MPRPSLIVGVVVAQNDVPAITLAYSLSLAWSAISTLLAFAQVRPGVLLSVCLFSVDELKLLQITVTEHYNSRRCRNDGNYM